MFTFPLMLQPEEALEEARDRCREPKPPGDGEQAHAVPLANGDWLVREAGPHRHGIAAGVGSCRVLEGAFQDAGQLRAGVIVAGQARAGTDAEQVQGLVRVAEQPYVPNARRHGPAAPREKSGQVNGPWHRFVEPREHGAQCTSRERRGPLIG